MIPALCEVTVDCRLLPGPDAGGGRERAIVRELLGDGDYEFEWLEGTAARARRSTRRSGTRVEASSPRIEPGRRSSPICVAGFTDSHWLREAFGTVAYGFFPMRTMDPEVAARLVHSADERIAVDDLELGVDFLRHAALGVASLP